MRAHIERDAITGIVKVWLFREEMGGTVFMWPSGYTNGCAEWTQEIVPPSQHRPDSVRPALEMAGFMWNAFVQAMRELDGDPPAGKLLTEVLKREQARVDALISALIKAGEPQMYLTSAPQEGI